MLGSILLCNPQPFYNTSCIIYIFIILYIYSKLGYIALIFGRRILNTFLATFDPGELALFALLLISMATAVHSKGTLYHAPVVLEKPPLSLFKQAKLSALHSLGDLYKQANIIYPFHYFN